MIFLDANPLVAFMDRNHSFHQRADRFIRGLRDENQRLVISPQVVGECFVYMTSKKVHEKPLLPESFEDVFGKLISSYAVKYISPGERAVSIALQAAIKRRVASAGIFDLLIYGTMLEHGITKIATFNVKHFRGLEGIELVEIP